jgi:hypothetical protein
MKRLRKNATYSWLWENAGDDRFISESFNLFLSAILIIKEKRFNGKLFSFTV